MPPSYSAAESLSQLDDVLSKAVRLSYAPKGRQYRMALGAFTSALLRLSRSMGIELMKEAFPETTDAMYFQGATRGR